MMEYRPSPTGALPGEWGAAGLCTGVQGGGEAEHARAAHSHHHPMIRHV